MKPSCLPLVLTAFLAVILCAAFEGAGVLDQLYGGPGLVEQINQSLTGEEPSSPATGGLQEQIAASGALPALQPTAAAPENEGGDWARGADALLAAPQAEPTIAVIQVTPPPDVETAEEQPASGDQLNWNNDTALPQQQAAVQYNGITLEAFAGSLYNGQPDDLVGVFAPDIMALPVRQQPSSDVNYVSSENYTVTQFGMPRTYGVTALLAHNYLSGDAFFNLLPGRAVYLIYGDSRTEAYRVVGTQSYQALSPLSPYSNFINVADASETIISSAELFNHVYTNEGKLVFQTCIEAYGDPSWGRLFVMAERIMN